MKTRRMIARTVLTAVILAAFSLGYVCGSIGQRRADAQGLGNVLEQAGKAGSLGSIGELGTSIVEMDKHVSGLQKNLDVLRGKELEFRVVGLDKKRGNIVLSRKAILEEAADHRKKVAAFVNGTPLFKGQVPDGDGFWFPCTLVAATNQDPVAREEVFGPVAAVIPFTDEEDAVRIANDTPYGLSGSIWTRDIGRALRVARAFETGNISINSGSSVHLEAPFGGVKQSGIGRELGLAALDAYTEWKTVYVDHS